MNKLEYRKDKVDENGCYPTNPFSLYPLPDMRLYFIALQFLTIIPIPFETRCQGEDLGRSVSFFPLAGLTIGGLLCVVNWLVSPWLARPLVDAILIGVLAAITGVLHLDGLADVCDGLAARGDRERFLSIMKDSNIGAAGAVAVAIGLLLKWQALLAVPENIKWQALLFFPLCSRFAQVLVMAGAQHARSDGLGALFIHGLKRSSLIVSLFATLPLTFLLLQFHGLLLLSGVMITAVAIRAYFQHRLGGITGDIVGCANELCEITALILLSAHIPL